MNQPFPMPGPAASAPAPFPSPTPPVAAPAQMSYPEQSRHMIRTKVTIKGAPISNQEQLDWAYALMVSKLGAKSSEPDMDKRIVGALASTTTIDFKEPANLAECTAMAVAQIPDKICYKGHKPSHGEYSLSTFQWLLGKWETDNPGRDRATGAVTLLAWLDSIPSHAPYELDDETRARVVTQAPPNPISDQTTPQVAQLAAVAPPPTAPAVPGAGEEKADGKTGEYVDKLSGYVCSSLRGLKSKVSKTHKKDWTAYCQEVGYDPETGKPHTGAPAMVQTPGMGAQLPNAAPPAGPGVPPLVGQQPVQQQSLFTPAPAAAMTHVTVQPQAPVPMTMPMPVPAAQVPAGIPYPMGAPTAQATSAQPMSTYVQVPAAQVPQNPPIYQPMTQPPQVPSNPQQMYQQPAQHPMMPTTAVSSFSRAENAKLLGGEVDLVLVRLVDAGAVPLTGRVDANQLAILAQQQALQSLTSVEDMKFRKDKQIAQRLFGEMLSKHPQIFILQNGYDLILPEGFLEVIAARCTSIYIMKDQGQSFTTIKFA